MSNTTTEEGARRRRANTAEILGEKKNNPKINVLWQKHYQQLLQMREDTTQRKDGLVETAKDEPQHFGLHMGDAGTDQYDQDFALSMLSSDQNALYEIEQALNRIRNGTYGICEISGQPIEAERLEAIPWTRFSATAQKELEDAGQTSRPGLGKRQSLTEPETVDGEEEPERSGD